MPQYTPRPKIAKLCAICSTEFTPHHSNYIYCSPACRAIGREAHVRERNAVLSQRVFDVSGTKVCKTCGESKPLAEYSAYRSGSYKTSCKTCAAEETRQRRLADPEHAKEIKRKTRAKNRERWAAEISARIVSDPEFRRKRVEAKRKWHAKNREYVAKKRAEYYATRGEIARRYSREVKLREPEKYKARTLVSSAVQCGRIPPAWSMVCERCQEAQAANWHHHKGYSEEYALDVIAVCLDCHGKEHRAL